MAATNETYEPYIVNKKQVATKIFADGKLIGVWVPFKNKPAIDLEKETIPEDATRLLFDKVKQIKHIDKLLSLHELERLSFISADCDPIKIQKKHPHLVNLSINNSSKNVINTVLAMFEHIDIIGITDYNAPIAGARIAAVKGINSLYLEGLYIKDLAALQQLSLKALYLHAIDFNEQVAAFVQSQPKLEILHLLTLQPISPADVDLDHLKHLKDLRLINHAATAGEWTQWAKSKGIALELLREDYVQPPAKAPKYQLDEIYKDVSIFKVTKSGKSRYEISDDLVRTFHKKGNNEDLEEALIEKIDPQQKRYEWSSEADTFIASAVKKEDIIKLIDTVAG